MWFWTRHRPSRMHAGKPCLGRAVFDRRLVLLATLPCGCLIWACWAWLDNQAVESRAGAAGADDCGRASTCRVGTGGLARVVTVDDGIAGEVTCACDLI